MRNRRDGRAHGWVSGAPSRTATTEHRRWRDAVLARPEQHTCQLRYDGCTIRATEADHVIEVSDGGPQFAVHNGQGACTSCHRVKTAKHARAKQVARTRRAPQRHPGLGPDA